MQYLPKEKVVLILVVSSLIFFAFMLSVTTNTITNVSAVEADGVGVYWDNECSNPLSSIDWGILELGSSKNVTCYIRNEGNSASTLSMHTSNWNPSKASDYITLRWDYAGKPMNPGETLQITLTLSISRYIEGISSFIFDIVITGSQNSLCDINGDLVVDFWDLISVAVNFGTVPPKPPECDVNGDGTVDLLDLVLVLLNFS